MKNLLMTLLTLLIVTQAEAQKAGMLAEQVPVGFAASNSVGFNGTTGGKGGDTVYCPKGGNLAAFLPATNPRVIIIDDTVVTAEIKNKKNISLLGRGTRAAMKGLAVTNCQNIIIRNITFYDSPDGLRITTTSSSASHHIWVDHCTFTDSPAVDLNGSSHDGLLDITHRSSWITVSWCEFNNHRKTCLLGYSASGGSGENEPQQLMVTYHHNFFNQTYSRHPRCRWAPVHVFNNYYFGGDYGVGSTCGAKVLVEKNYYEGTSKPILISLVNDPGGILSGDPVGYVKSVDNYLLNSGPSAENLGNWDFSPQTYYTYTPDPAINVKDIVKAQAGAGKVDVLTETGGDNFGSIRPSAFEVEQNYPNPFNPATSIAFGVPSAGNVRVEIFNVLGTRLSVPLDGFKQSGYYKIDFNAGNLSSGTYYYRVSSPAGSITKKMVLIR